MIAQMKWEHWVLDCFWWEIKDLLDEHTNNYWKIVSISPAGDKRYTIVLQKEMLDQEKTKEKLQEKMKEMVEMKRKEMLEEKTP